MPTGCSIWDQEPAPVNQDPDIFPRNTACPYLLHNLREEELYRRVACHVVGDNEDSRNTGHGLLPDQIFEAGFPHRPFKGFRKRRSPIPAVSVSRPVQGSRCVDAVQVASPEVERLRPPVGKSVFHLPGPRMKEATVSPQTLLDTESGTASSLSMRSYSSFACSISGIGTSVPKTIRSNGWGAEPALL